MYKNKILLTYLAFLFFKYIKLKFNKMSKFKDNFSSESFYPDSNYYLDQDNTPQEKTNFRRSKIQYGGEF